MRKIFEDMFYKDLESIELLSKKYNGKDYSITQKELERHDEFWNSLNNEQKKQFIEHESVVASNNAVLQKEIYIYAIKKGLSLALSSNIDFDE